VAENNESAKSTPNYTVKQVQQIVRSTDVLVRLFTLAPTDMIPWHHHSHATEHYFVLSGVLKILTRDSDTTRTLAVGEHWHVTPGTPHNIRNGGLEDCRFLLIQGVGKHDFIADPV
jgi:quercetin dioxygenase-like cupin family protein